MAFNNYKDFDKISLKININGEIYCSVLLLDNEKLILNVDFTKNKNLCKNSIEHFDLINGNILYKNIGLTLINCDYVGSEYNNRHVILKYRVDRILYGLELKKYKTKRINKYTVVYDGINSFTNDKPFKIDYKELMYSANTNSYKIVTIDSNLFVNFSSNISFADLNLSISRSTFVSFEVNSKVNIEGVLNGIYKFRNFLMLILKKGISIEEQYVFIDEKKYRIFDCFVDKPYRHNKNLEELLKFHGLKIEEIDNLSEIYENYLLNYDKLLPVIELFYNVIHFNVPNILKFVNATTLLELYCRKYNISTAIQLTQTIKPTKKEAEYQYMIEALINNVNEYYQLDSLKISAISKNIKDARVQYIHYLEGKHKFELTSSQQFWYSSFIEDLVLLNIYKLLKLDITKYSDISFLNFYYSINDLI